MKKSNNIFLSFMAVCMLSILFIACDCDDPTNPECSNFDPCLVTTDTETSANFTIYECVLCGWPDSLLRETDTIFGGDVLFEAHDDLESYEWTVGTDARVFTSKSFVLNFSSFVGSVTVQLVGKKTPNTTCYPNDDGIDTIQKTFHVLGNTFPTGSPFLEKKYTGYNEDEPDSIFTIEFMEYATFDNFPKDCHKPELLSIYVWIGVAAGFTACRIMNDGTNYSACGYPTGYGELQEDRKTLIIYYQLTENGVRVDKKFIGKLIE